MNDGACARWAWLPMQMPVPVPVPVPVRGRGDRSGLSPRGAGHRRKIGMDSHLVVMRFQGSRGNEIADNFLRIKRGLDLYWKTFANDFPILVILLPFASSSAKDGFLERVEAWLESHFKGDFVSLEVLLHVIDFDVRDPLGLLMEAMATP